MGGAGTGWGLCRLLGPVWAGMVRGLRPGLIPVFARQRASTTVLPGSSRVSDTHCLGSPSDWRLRKT